MAGKKGMRHSIPKITCSATSRATGQRCKNAPAVGGFTVCRFHGAGGSPRYEDRREHEEAQRILSRALVRAEALALALGRPPTDAEVATDLFVLDPNRGRPTDASRQRRAARVAAVAEAQRIQRDLAEVL